MPPREGARPAQGFAGLSHPGKAPSARSLLKVRLRSSDGEKGRIQLVDPGGGEGDPWGQ